MVHKKLECVCLSVCVWRGKKGWRLTEAKGKEQRKMKVLEEKSLHFTKDIILLPYV